MCSPSFGITYHGRLSLRVVNYKAQMHGDKAQNQNQERTMHYFLRQFIIYPRQKTPNVNIIYMGAKIIHQTLFTRALNSIVLQSLRRSSCEIM